MSREILGFTKDGEPIYPIQPGLIASAAVIACSACHTVIRGMGGPMLGAVCRACWYKTPLPRVLLKKHYSAEELSDLQRDVYEAFDPAFTPQAAGIPKDEHGFDEGTYTVIVKWEPSR